MDDSIIVKLVYLPQDFARASSFFQQTIYLRKHWIILCPIVVFFGIIALIFSMSYKSDDLNIFAIIILALIPSVIIFLVVLLLDKNTKWMAKHDKISPWVMSKSVAKHYEHYPQLEEAVSIIFSDEGIKYAFASLTEKYNWFSFSKAIESKDDIFLFFTNTDFVFFPKRALISQNQESELKKIIKQNLGNKAKF